ncbi:MAG: saccharopine dehydrogenase, partial [Candidatus Adiutrix sp.]|nr:saccharopine dehydrogenase [Candidatus Adiutrix sp.]
KGLHEYGILSNPKVRFQGAEAGLMSLIGDYLQNCEAGRSTALYGYALHVEVTGSRAGKRKRAILTHTHPASDGSIPDWAGLRAYTRNVGIPLAIAAECLARGRVKKTGVLIPEEAFVPEEIFEELKKRSIYVHEQWSDD